MVRINYVILAWYSSFQSLYQINCSDIIIPTSFAFDLTCLITTPTADTYWSSYDRIDLTQSKFLSLYQHFSVLTCMYLLRCNSRVYCFQVITYLHFTSFQSARITTLKRTTPKKLRRAPCIKFNQTKWDISALRSVLGEAQKCLCSLTISMLSCEHQPESENHIKRASRRRHSLGVDAIWKFKYTVFINKTLNSHLNSTGTVMFGK